MSRKLDAAIAEALGYSVIYAKSYQNGGLYKNENMPAILKDCFMDTCPRYSGGGDAMLELIGEMKEKGWQLQVGIYSNMITCDYWRHGSTIIVEKVLIDTTDKSLPESVVLCAYKALTGKDWGNLE